MNKKRASNAKQAAGSPKRQAAPTQADQAPRSRDELRRAQLMRVQKKRRRKKAALSLVLFLLILCVGAVLTLTVFFHISNYEIKGNSRYTAQEIIDASGIAKGENLFLCKTEQAAGRIQEKLPYVDTVTIRRKLPDKLVITVEEAQLKLAVQQGNAWLVMTGGGKVLEIGATELPQGAAELKGVAVKSASPGKQAVFPPKMQQAETATQAGESTQAGEEGGQSLEKTVLDHLLQAARQAGLADMTQIDLTNLNDIRVTWRGRIVLLLGEDEHLAQKMGLGLEVIARQDADGTEKKGSINLTIPKKAFFSETIETEPAQPPAAQVTSQPAA